MCSAIVLGMELDSMFYPSGVGFKQWSWLGVGYASVKWTVCGRAEESAPLKLTLYGVHGMYIRVVVDRLFSASARVHSLDSVKTNHVDQIHLSLVPIGLRCLG
jgi:hypothetical protein